ncbi:TVP38/TMEM64 family protein [Endozoicomonas sp. Mp262]|uniref:TVP38/TMEM64 family protein n=1 Tax=Endozoicomonas sp. Mp262 TaxID=2919499 RepID=UPI0021DB220C
MARNKLILIVAIVGAIGAFYQFGGEDYLTPGFFRALYSDNPVLTGVVFFMAYIAVTGLSLPGAAILTLMSGFIFGFWPALLMVSFASSIGATLAFLFSRTLLREWVQGKFASYMETINKGVAKDGAFYLFTLRLIPAVPFFVINLVMGLMPIKTWTFYWVSQVGMLAGTAVYINAGAQVGKIEELSVSGILTPALIGSFVLLGIFPLLVRKGMEYWKKQRQGQ